MTVAAIGQLGLTLVYTAMAVLMALIYRAERHRVMRIWVMVFILLAVDAALGYGVRMGLLPHYATNFSILALSAGGILSLVGTVMFLGRPLPKGVYVLASLALVSVLVGAACGFSRLQIDLTVFPLIGVAMCWTGALALGAGVRGGSGQWVAASAFIGTGLYAFVWPFIEEYVWVEWIEFFFDLCVVLWAAAGVLLMHFERSRERERQGALEQLALRAQLERSERMEALGRLAGGVAHDFNNVLATVISGSELVLRQIDEKSPAASQLRMVLESAKGAAGFTRQLLDLGRRSLPGKSPQRLQSAVETAFSVLRPLLTSGVRLVTQANYGDVYVKAAEGQIEQILINLGRNAIQAMPSGGVLSIIAERPENGRLILRICDTGEGMDEATRNRIFEPFFSTRHRTGGTGLGLAAVYFIVGQLEGTIEVVSEPGQGATFTVLLPLCSASELEVPAAVGGS